MRVAGVIDSLGSNSSASLSECAMGAGAVTITVPRLQRGIRWGTGADMPDMRGICEICEAMGVLLMLMWLWEKVGMAAWGCRGRGIRCGTGSIMQSRYLGNGRQKGR